MAIYHLSVKPVQRSKGRSATASAAYRAGEKIEDKRTGEVHDYTRKQGVVYSEIMLPENVKMTRTELWNAAELSEKRKDGTTAREYEIALPAELTQEQQKALARDFAAHLVERYGVAADVCIHAPSRQGDDRNAHAHILTTTREVSAAGLGKKATVELCDSDRVKKGLQGRKAELQGLREAWAAHCNRALEKAGHSQRIDHRSLAAQGIQREPSMHLGPTATAMERRGEMSERGEKNRQRAGVSADRQELMFLEEIQAGIQNGYNYVRKWQDERDRVLHRKAEEERIKEAQEREKREQERLAAEQARNVKVCRIMLCVAAIDELERQKQAELEKQEREKQAELERQKEAERERIAQQRAARRSHSRGYSMGR